MPLSKQEDFFVPEFSEEQVSIATTEFSTHAASDVNRSYITGMDDTVSPGEAGSTREDSNAHVTSVSDIRLTPDKRIQEDFGGEDHTNFESESDITTEEDEEQDTIFIKPTKPAPRKKLNSKITGVTNRKVSTNPIKINEV